MTISSKHLTKEELSFKLNQAKKIVEIGAIYIHTRSQERYKVLNLVVLESLQEIAVLYQKVGDSSSFLWVRALNSWTESQEIDGCLVPRFQKDNS